MSALTTPPRKGTVIWLPASPGYADRDKWEGLPIERHLCRHDCDTRDDFPDFRSWAEDFQAIYDANPNACDTYCIDVEDYALKRAKEAGFTPCKDPDHV